MVDGPEGPRPVVVHTIGARLDELSVGDFDERIDLLRQEIARLDIAKRQKQAALDGAGLIFKPAMPKS